MVLRGILPVVALVFAVGFGGEITPGAEADKFKLSMRASPAAAVAPVRVSVTAELRGDGDEEKCYCPTVEWDWGDGSRSQRTGDCQPYEAGKSETDRFYVAAHHYHDGGRYEVRLRLKRQDRLVASGHVLVLVRPRLDERTEPE